jgi:hypothetical protein
MGRFVFLASGAIVAVLATAYQASSGLIPVAPVGANNVDRSAKGDLLTSARVGPRQSPAIASVDIAGGGSPLVVYRDQDGQVLFSADPIAQETTFSKDFQLPARLTIQTAVQPLPQRPVTPSAPTSAREPKREPKLLIGCEPTVSPLAAPALARLSGRCLS